MMLGSARYTLHRTAPGQFVDGVWETGAASTLTVQGSLQPLRPREVQALPEGLRQRARWRFYSKTRLKVLDEETGQAPDEIEVDGERLLVAGVEDFTRGITGPLASLAHYKYLLIEPEDVGAGGGL